MGPGNCDSLNPDLGGSVVLQYAWRREKARLEEMKAVEEISAKNKHDDLQLYLKMLTPSKCGGH